MNQSSNQPHHPVLLADSDPLWLKGAVETLEEVGVRDVVLSECADKTRELLRQQQFSAMVFDPAQFDGQADHFLLETMSNHPELPVIISTDEHEIEAATEWIKAGAFNFNIKSRQPHVFAASVKNAIRCRSMYQEIDFLHDEMLRGELSQPPAFAAFSWRTEKMTKIFRYVEAIAKFEEPVLITGESGTGKELLAKAVHAASGRTGNFVAVNTAGFDDSNFSDNLFGHKRGAFTGADKPRLGFIEQAQGGTLFLDEIGDLNLNAQVKLLRLIQENEFYPLGSDHLVTSKARIVAATNQNLLEMIQEQRFRNDLYHRLHHHVVHLPPLRERKEDIGILFKRFVLESCAKYDLQIPRYTNKHIELLKAYEFPGNIRELISLARETAATSKGRRTINFSRYFRDVRAARQAKANQKQAEGGNPNENHNGTLDLAALENFPTLEEFNNLILVEAMKRAEGVQIKAAKLLGITPSSLSKKLKKAKLFQHYPLTPELEPDSSPRKTDGRNANP